MTLFASIDIEDPRAEKLQQANWDWLGDVGPTPLEVEIAIDDYVQVVLELLPRPRIRCVGVRVDELERGQLRLARRLLDNDTAAEALHQFLVSVEPNEPEPGPLGIIERALAFSEIVRALDLPPRWEDATGLWPSAWPAADAAAVALRRLPSSLQGLDNAARSPVMGTISGLRRICSPVTEQTLNAIRHEWPLPDSDQADPDDDTWTRFGESFANAPVTYEVQSHGAYVFRSGPRPDVMAAADVEDIERLGLTDIPPVVRATPIEHEPSPSDREPEQDVGWKVSIPLRPAVSKAFTGLVEAWQSARNAPSDSARDGVVLRYGALIAEAALPYSLEDLELSMSDAGGGAPPMLPDVRCEVEHNGLTARLGMEVTGEAGEPLELVTYLPIDPTQVECRFIVAARGSMYVRSEGLCAWLLTYRHRRRNSQRGLDRRRTRELLKKVRDALSDLGAERELEALRIEAGTANDVVGMATELGRLRALMEEQTEGVRFLLVEALDISDLDQVRHLARELYCLRLYLGLPPG